MNALGPASGEGNEKRVTKKRRIKTWNVPCALLNSHYCTQKALGSMELSKTWPDRVCDGERLPHVWMAERLIKNPVQ
jgi:hypothetical protein